MKSRIFRLITTAGFILIAAAACQTTPSQPATITSQNAAQLKAVAQVSTGNTVSDLVWSSDSTTLTAMSGNGALRLAGDSLETLDDFSFESPAAIYAASPDGKTIAFSEDSYNIFLADTSVTAAACTIYSPYWVGYVDFSADGASLLTTSMDEILVTLWDSACGEQLQNISGFETAAPVYSAKFGEDGKHIIWLSRGRVQLSDIASQELGPEFSHEDFVVSTALAPDSSLLATAAAGTVDGEFTPVIYLWDPASGEQKAVLTNPDPFNIIAFSPDSSLIAATVDSAILIWDTTALEQVAEISGNTKGIYELVFSPDGSSLATADMEGTVTLWQIE